jgi:DNA invertase Pin-like site-specific DNA recombinase
LIGEESGVVGTKTTEHFNGRKSEHPSKTRAAIYARISLDRDGDQLGVSRQRKDCRRVCADRGWKVADEYVDNNISATNRRVVRPEYQRLLADIRDGKIDAVVVYDLDRLTRRPIELEGFVNTCALAGVTQLVFVGGGVDMGTGDGLLVARIKGAFAAEECRKLSQRMRRKKVEQAENGTLLGGGNRPFGFKADRFTHDQVEADLLREAASRVLRGERLLLIVRDWRERGIRSSTGIQWAVESLRVSLCNPRTAGLQVHRGEVVGEAAFEGILDRETWDQVTQALSRKPRILTPHFPFNGIVRCGECGSFLTGWIKRQSLRERHFYRCSRWRGDCGGVAVSGVPLEEYIFGLIKALANDPGVRTVVESMMSKHQDDALEMDARIAKDERRLQTIDESFSEHRIPRAEWLIQRRRLETRIVERTNDRANLLGWSALDRLATGWDSTPAEEQTRLTQSLIRSIRVSRIGLGASKNKFNPSRVVIDWRDDGVLACFLKELDALIAEG